MILLYALTTVHVLVCVFLILVVLLQSGKAADLAGAFGGMGSQTAFGPRGSATLLSKLTTGSAIVFMLTSLSLSVLATRDSGGSGSVLETAPPPARTAPAAPGGAPPAPPAGQPAPGPSPAGGQGPAATVEIPMGPAPGAPAQQQPKR